MKTKKALFAGTFEIFHSGHVDVLLQAAGLFDFVYVAVSYNPYKTNASPIDERLERAQAKIAELKLTNVAVIKNNGFGVICARLNGCQYLVRGIRNVNDVQHELDLATRNQELEPTIRTVLLVAKNELRHTSSTNILTPKK
ncbi:pantetheine-phosphate adenylyltransferase [Mycoplasmoides fastidiosum]|uniref:Pantetheine-phosphate adenylyltransferase n=1 Tax=Mycoplasmoides fastidiosum TaxID=92758 RepID=A0ABU0LZN7_9BACT|nr:pantetheine-phosphate adenylyltransferase [Mycoplasmoides fastidiosum]MDQ0514050.1 pantetheine-phosphate adenylyltransferase [Mycoplasmoides fastidiosum]UUD37539.1 pantetheine-phosphate adenylyltransferase [Mycoplasmoides fastidiosum]